MSLNTRWYKILIRYLVFIGIIGILTQVGGCGGSSGSSESSGSSGSSSNNASNSGGSPQYYYAGLWSGTTDQGLSLAFNVEQIASNDITHIAFTVDMGGSDSNLQVTESGMVERIENDESRVHLQSGSYSLDIVFYFDFANLAHGTWSAYRTDSPNITVDGTFTAHKGLTDCPDSDGDGYHNNCGQLDCRIDDADIHPGATEVCDDAIDNDCDDLIDCYDPDCVGDPACSDCTDSDADDFFAGAGCPQASDCNDNDNTIYPGATEICDNGIDDNCDGSTDEGCSNNGGPGPHFYFAGPWSGTTDQGLKLAFNVEEIALGDIASYDITSIAFTVQMDGSDCNESFLRVTELGMAERIDHNASRVHLESGPFSMDIDFYFDFANLAHGDWFAYRTDSPNITFVGTFTAHKGQTDCSDRDLDGYYNYCGQIDCRIADPEIHPGATEVCNDNIDNDCDDLIDCHDPDCHDTLECCQNATDADFDGFFVEAGCGTAEDCNDNNTTINPGATEVCNDMGDNDCDGLLNCNDPDCVGDPACAGCTDSDADDFFAGTGCPQASDCNDNDDTIHPGATEICNNGIDDDCDGPPADEGCSNNTLKVPGDYSTIQAALDAAQHGDTVLVADGTYHENIRFRNAKAITLVSQNGAGATILDGGQTGSVIAFETENNSTLNGFTITNGSAVNGGGILCDISSSPTINNCIITNNEAVIGGGGIHCASSSAPLITNSIIQNNSVTAVNNNLSNGGGIHASFFSTPTISNCIIKNNTSNWGGGGLALNNAFEPKIVNCIFSNNTADVIGGAISFQNSAPEITNCTFSNNTADVNGGAISFQNSAPQITNSTFSSNSTPGNGGAIACTNLRPEAAVVNSILWDNPDRESAGEIAVSGSRFLNITYSDVKGGYCGMGNINADPFFAGADDYHLPADSPCIDAGTASGAPSTDIDGDARPVGAGYDMGADEYVP